MYIQYTNPSGLPPLESCSRIFASLGWQISFLGIHADGSADGLQFSPDTLASTKLLKRWGSGWTLKLHFLAFVLWCWFKVLIDRPNVIWLSDRSACPLGAFLARATSIPLVYQEHDGPSGLPRGRIDKALSDTRKALSARARICILPNAARAEAFRAEMPNSNQIATVMNCPSLAEINGVERVPRPAKGLRVYYHGSLVPARLPLTLLAALSRLPDSFELSIVGFETNGNHGYIGRFLEEASALGLQSRVRYEGVVTPRELLFRRCSQSDVGLALLPLKTRDPNERNMAGATNKVFDYLACGLAVLIPDMPDHRRLFLEAGVALACDPDEPESIAAALDWFASHLDETREMGQRGRARVLTDWNYESQFGPVLDRIANL